MTKSASFPLLKHPAFRGISQAAISNLKSSCKVLRFELGGQLCDPNDIPARILVILQGQARLVGRHNGRLTTVGKFGPGSVIGAASLLCGAPCENVIAAQEVIACGLSDELWRDLYSREASFRHWCDQQLWPQELLKLLEALEQNTPETDSSAFAKLEGALQSAKRCFPDQAQAVDHIALRTEAAHRWQHFSVLDGRAGDGRISPVALLVVGCIRPSVSRQ